ncbi:Retrovirus-related Pol polyprotein from transposon RE1 [Vitis vinifera]|uniref:Retrovirus-related Pol polyprotein from transposon RE1 n=1 Tax=Vitis vinifera TaxID=29760 RepID=A0A438CYK4_VITVI|nr:Retrovirus-related Pol polyprotein from transposon RE1 [Vitis vinifera]
MGSCFFTPGKSTVGCRWVYTVKVGPDGQVDRLKARLVVKGYTQIYGCDYGDTFSPIAKVASVRLFLSMAAMCHWPLYQLDIKNAFLHGELLEESVYGAITYPPRHGLGVLVQLFKSLEMFRSEADHSVFYHHNSSSQCIYFVVYVDDIVITGSDQEGIQRLSNTFSTTFKPKTWANSSMLECKPVDTPMDPNVKLVPGQGEPLRDHGRYRRLVGKLNYLTITRPDISFPEHQAKVCCMKTRVIPKLLVTKMQTGVGSPSNRRSTSGYCVIIGGKLISWKSKKQDVVVRSSAEAEYRAIALATCELIWLRQLFQELRFGKDEQIKLVCDNQTALHIASNPVFHERTKHIEVDYHFIREKIASGCVATSFVNSNDQLADIFTKSLKGPRIKYICSKLDAYDIYAPV